MERTELIAREGIRDLLARYTWAADRGRVDEVVDCFVEDGVLATRTAPGGDGEAWEGRERIGSELRAVVERVATAGATPSPVQHQVTGTRIDVVDFSTAQVRSYFSVLTDVGVDHWGTYHDDVVLDPADSTWRFARRTVRVLGWAPASRFATR